MGCVNSVKTVVEKLPGVSRANVSLNPSQAMIEFDPKLLSIKLKQQSSMQALMSLNQ